ncbi:expressed unknown protein [Seminavis robusta]|uniref:Uncharacterized protein n=1 Tax=Seminavis robusta TaxID=568900 RepID=A0A9N8DPD8_9STRA|nr:expressed unknown protein [Seminavis robusta]|eukprot:Sro259_g101450.1 n/a (1109) ;mRNA; r:64935-68261
MSSTRAPETDHQLGPYSRYRDLPEDESRVTEDEYYADDIAAFNRIGNYFDEEASFCPSGASRCSYYDDDWSYYSERSYVSGERSYYSDEERSYYSDEERSYYSEPEDEDEQIDGTEAQELRSTPEMGQPTGENDRDSNSEAMQAEANSRLAEAQVSHDGKDEAPSGSGLEKEDDELDCKPKAKDGPQSSSRDGEIPQLSTEMDQGEAWVAELIPVLGSMGATNSTQQPMESIQPAGDDASVVVGPAAAATLQIDEGWAASVDLPVEAGQEAAGRPDEAIVNPQAPELLPLFARPIDIDARPNIPADDNDDRSYYTNEGSYYSGSYSNHEGSYYSGSCYSLRSPLIYTSSWERNDGLAFYNLDLKVMDESSPRRQWLGTCGNSFSVYASLTYRPTSKVPITGITALDDEICSYLPAKEPVGFLRGTLYRPPFRSFGSSEETRHPLHHVCRMFFSEDGQTVLDNPELGEDSLSSGCFFYIDKIGLQPGHTGHDVGIAMIYETMDLLNNQTDSLEIKCSLAVAQPMPLGRVHARPVPNSAPSYDGWLQQMDVNGNDEHYDFHLARKKLWLQFARLGFRQAGKDPARCKVWFATPRMLENAVEWENDIKYDWQPKETIAASVEMHVYEPPIRDIATIKQRKLQRLLLDMHKALRGVTNLEAEIRAGLNSCEREWCLGVPPTAPRLIFESWAEDLRSQCLGSILESEVRSGISTLECMMETLRCWLNDGDIDLDAARALHYCVANAPALSGAGTIILHELVANGALPHLPDEQGETALQMAAGLARPACLCYLLSDPVIRYRRYGEITAKLHCGYQRALKHDLSDDRALLPSAVEPFVESALTVMSQFQRDALVGHILPPRTLAVLALTALGEVRKMEEKLAQARLDDMTPAVCEEVNPHLTFVPASCLQDQLRYLRGVRPVGRSHPWPLPVWFRNSDQRSRRSRRGLGVGGLRRRTTENAWAQIAMHHLELWKALYLVLKRGNVPTRQNLSDAMGKSNGKPRGPPWSCHGFEHVLAALFAVVEKLTAKERSELLSDSSHYDLPETPLDEMYVVVWWLCSKDWNPRMKRGPDNGGWERLRRRERRTTITAPVPSSSKRGPSSPKHQSPRRQNI